MYYMDTTTAAGELGKIDSEESKNNPTKRTCFLLFWDGHVYVWTPTIIL